MHWYSMDGLHQLAAGQNPNEPWYRLILLEAMLFEPYYPLGVALVGSNFAGLSGAALTSACLAYLGGGTIAAGGAGMLGGTIAVVGGGAALGISVGAGVGGAVASAGLLGKKNTIMQSAKLLTSVREITVLLLKDYKCNGNL